MWNRFKLDKKFTEKSCKVCFWKWKRPGTQRVSQKIDILTRLDSQIGEIVGVREILTE